MTVSIGMCSLKWSSQNHNICTSMFRSGAIYFWNRKMWSRTPN